MRYFSFLCPTNKVKYNFKVVIYKRKITNLNYLVKNYLGINLTKVVQDSYGKFLTCLEKKNLQLSPF